MLENEPDDFVIPPLRDVRISHPLMVGEDTRLGPSLGVRTKWWSREKVRGHNWPRGLPSHTKESYALARQLARHCATGQGVAAEERVE